MEQPLALVVEDEADLSIIFAKALRSAGYRVEITQYGNAALAWLSTTTPDLIVLDLQLPKVSGDQILNHVRADPRLANVSVIIATAYPHIAETLHDQADWVFLKPVAYSQLRDLAARLRGDTSSDVPPVRRRSYRGGYNASGSSKPLANASGSSKPLANASGSGKPLANASGSSKPLALVIDDDQDLSVILSETLRAAGFRTEVLSTGTEALGRLDTATPDVVVLDLDSRNELGADALRRIRSDDRLAKTHVVVATALSRVAESARSEANMVLLKPLSPSRLREISAQLQNILVKNRPR